VTGQSALRFERQRLPSGDDQMFLGEDVEKLLEIVPFERSTEIGVYFYSERRK
jgi:hypothetical protein